jgi:hypothetical protein
MPRISGKAGSAIINGLTWICTEWEYEESNDNVEARAMGDFWTERIALFQDYTIQMKGYLSSAEPYVNTAIPVGGTVVFSLRLLATSTSAFITDTGLCTRGRIFTPHNGPVTLECTVVSTEGANPGPIFDTTP